MKYFIALFLIISFPVIAQNINNETGTGNNISVIDVYKSDVYQKTIKDIYQQREKYFPEISSEDAIAEIQDLIDQGYRNVSHPNGLIGYIDDIKRNERDAQKVKEIHYYAVANAIPPEEKLLDTPEKRAANSKRFKNTIERSMNLTSEELDEYIKSVQEQ